MPGTQTKDGENQNFLTIWFYSVFESKDHYSFYFGYWLFGRTLGLITLLAFLSYWIQADALIGIDGLLPWEKNLSKIETITEQNSNLNKFTLLPTLLWFEPFANHNLLFSIGTLAAFLLTIGLIPLISATITYIIYLSLMVVGEPFLSFQWDALLTETLFLSIFLLPGTTLHRFSDCITFPRFGQFLIIFLLVKLMIESGIVKLTYFAGDGSNTWRELTALDFHYWTQPIPNSLSPWVHSMPSWFDKGCLYLMFGIELILPLLLFLRGNPRRLALVGQIMLQIAILASGNYGFFNLLTLCLCIPLIDDQILPKNIKNKYLYSVPEIRNGNSTVRIGTILFLSSVLIITAFGHIVNDLNGNRTGDYKNYQVPAWVKNLQAEARIFRSFNSYGLFRVMTTTRPEIIIEASLDGQSWKTYKFKWKPSCKNQDLHFTGPHMPRIDWQMWFEGLNFENYSQHPFSRFLYARYLQMMINGQSTQDCFNLSLVLGQREFQALKKAPKSIQSQAVSNFQNLMQSFTARSNWFGLFLRKLGQGNEIILNELSGSNPVDFKPAYLRVSLKHFKFSDKPNQIWEVSDIPDASFMLTSPSINQSDKEKP
jgi:hypothetical protein